MSLSPCARLSSPPLTWISPCRSRDARLDYGVAETAEGAGDCRDGREHGCRADRGVVAADPRRSSPRSGRTGTDSARGAGGAGLPAGRRSDPDRPGGRTASCTRRGSRRLLLVLASGAGGPLSGSLLVTDRMLGSGQRRPAGSPVQQTVDRARQAFRGWSGQRRYHLVHWHVRPGPGAAGQRPGNDAHVGRAHRPPLRADPGAGAARRVAERVFRGDRQRPAPRRGAGGRVAGRRSAAGSHRARARGDARRNEGLQPARPRRRGLYHLHQVGVGASGDLSACAARALRGLQRRRGGARHLQGSRPADEPCRSRVRRHERRRRDDRCRKGAAVPARRVRLSAAGIAGESRTPPAPTSAARKRRCSSRSKASAASRAFGRPSRSTRATAVNRRW